MMLAEANAKRGCLVAGNCLPEVAQIIEMTDERCEQKFHRCEAIC